MIGRESCDDTVNVGNGTDTAWDYRPNYCPMKTYKTTISDLTEGTRVDWSNTVLPNWFYAIQYEATTIGEDGMLPQVLRTGNFFQLDSRMSRRREKCLAEEESDTAPVFDMPVVRVSRPDHLPIDTSLIQFYFTDADYGDSYVKYFPDYDHPYLYFDSNELAIYTKAALPHNIGTHEQETTFVIWAEDGCYNRVTGTVTVTTYNEAPQFHYLPETVTIHENRTGEMYSINVTDHQNDPITCTVRNITPSTDPGFFFIDQGTKVMLDDAFSLNKTLVSEYTLGLSCSDGTDENTDYVIFEISDEPPDSGIPNLDLNSKAKTLSSSSIIGVIGAGISLLLL